MQNRRGSRIIICILVLCVLVTCGRKQGISEKTAAIVGEDTLTMSHLTELSVDTADPDEIRRAAVQISLAKKSRPPADSVRHFKAVEEISEQMSLRSDKQWNREQVSSLLLAAQTLKKRLDKGHNESAIVRYVDSLFNSVSLQGSPNSGNRTDGIESQSAARTQDSRVVLTSIVGASFNLPPELADIIAGYAFEDDGSRTKEKAVAGIVKGLVHDPSKDAMRRAHQPDAEFARRDNSMLALRYRTRNSIMDSIGRHLQYLEAIYKRQLKIQQTMAGTVTVSFRVDASGRVISARVVRSDINEKAFLNPFLDYVKTIHFLPIPEKVGPMTFEFPFEFKTDL